MREAVEKCVHCGLCLPTCPTYQLLGCENDSPRGRIVLMKTVLEGKLSPNSTSEYIDNCLGCDACQTACPSGVEYGKLLTSYRAITDREKNSSFSQRLQSKIVSFTIPFPFRFRIAIRLGKLFRPLRGILPTFARPMIELVPDQIPKTVKVPEISPAIGQRRARVGLLLGCAQSVLAPQINAATIRVLNRNGVEVIAPRNQSCCGALDWHNGKLKQARKLASLNFPLFPTDLDGIVINAAGCGSAFRDYSVMFAGTENEESATRFGDQSIDVSVFLDQLGLIGEPRFEKTTRVAYHDACHLIHAQGVSTPPRKILGAIENLDLIPLTDPDRCCGSAGTYNIDRPELAKQLGDLKAQSIVDSDCEIVAAGNIGCLVQIENRLKAVGSSQRVLHTIEILDSAYQS
ncbi:heterodisulfide reductase-related iron-sulfur binding cluster [Vicingaceae bacterium]|nr:heterodisulfide reductase-related iron-sulfur binding cluster [Vicingaceae bacterium]